MKKIILASASKRRSEILKSCGIPHRIVISNAKEILDNKIPISKIVETNAKIKAMAVMPKYKNAVIIGSDTLVAHNNDILGKPKDKKMARSMLSRFSGNQIEVYTGLCVIDTAVKKEASGVEISRILVKKLTNKEVKEYFELLGPYDKAGGFSIEGIGSMIFDNIEGSYFNILGLPMTKLKELFDEIGLDILDFVKQ